MNIHSDMTVYKDMESKKPIFTNSANFSNGSHYETNLTLNLHTGTHIDAPLHMVKDGATMESYDLRQFISPCRVLDLTHLTHSIGENDLTPFKIKKGETLIFKTRNSDEDFFNLNFIYLDKSGAKYLSNFKLNGVGIDSLGIERSQSNHETHKLLLGQGTFILEGLRLKNVSDGHYTLVCLPLKINNVEASMTRAVLMK